MGRTIKYTTAEEMDQLREILSTTLPIARKTTNFTQTEVARRIGIGTGKSYISRLEAGVNLPSLHCLWKLAEVLDCSADYLLGFSSYHQLPRKNSIQDQLLREIEALDMEDKIDLLNELKKRHK